MRAGDIPTYENTKCPFYCHSAPCSQDDKSKYTLENSVICLKLLVWITSAVEIVRVDREWTFIAKMSESSAKPDENRKSDKRGILRLDISKPRLSAGSVEFRNQPELLSEVKITTNFFGHTTFLCCSNPIVFHQSRPKVVLKAISLDIVMYLIWNVNMR